MNEIFVILKVGRKWPRDCEPGECRGCGWTCYASAKELCVEMIFGEDPPLNSVPKAGMTIGPFCEACAACVLH